MCRVLGIQALNFTHFVATKMNLRKNSITTVCIVKVSILYALRVITKRECDTTATTILKRMYLVEKEVSLNLIDDLHFLSLKMFTFFRFYFKNF